MVRGLRFKFLLLLLTVAAIALSSAIILRDLMIRDFRAFLEGQSEDKVYLVQASFEGAYERNAGWRRADLTQEVIQALGLGFETRLIDGEGNLVIDTVGALKGVSPLIKKRLDSLGLFREGAQTGPFTPYPLFLGGKQIGSLEVRELRPSKEDTFLGRSDWFLILSILLVGCIAALLSIVFSGRLTRPIEELARAASAISRGELKKRVAATRRDEVGDLARAFNTMAKNLETHESLRRKLITDVAHELRTPLGAIRGELEAMVDGLIPNDPDHLQSLYDETGRLKNLVDGIEDLNQAESSILSLKREHIAVRPFLENMVELFRTRFHQKGVELKIEGDTGQELYADPDRLSQIMVNLLSNALKATGEGGHVSILVKPVDGGLAITVRDSGSGIREEDFPFIFERFYRGPGGGLGIGLTIVKEIAEAHGARIEAESAPGAGSSFTILFPPEAVHNSS